MSNESFAVVPGHGLGFMTLGACLQDILSKIKEDRTRFPQVDLSFSQHRPLSCPVVIALPANGLRLRFDGAEQRLRLIEVLEFGRVSLTYKGSELAKDGHTVPYKRIYQLFSASYPGEYMPPHSGRMGTYVVSYPGIAFTFPLQDAAYGPEKDHVQLLGSHAASPATFMALFEGNSWPECRDQLFISTPLGPRNSAIATQPKDGLAAELEFASIEEGGRVVLFRRAPAPPFLITLGQTTPQDLVTELGPPDATHKRDTSVTVEPSTTPRPRSTSRTTSMSNGRHRPTPPSSYSSTGTDAFDTDFDSGEAEDDSCERASREVYWCYFSHGLDILVGPPPAGVDYMSSTFCSTAVHEAPLTPCSTSTHLVVRKVVMHGNIPGSYVFNRHRRLRWTLEIPSASSQITSEHTFDEIEPLLHHALFPSNDFPLSSDHRPVPAGKVINRTWGGGSAGSNALHASDDSTFFLPDADRDLVEDGSTSSEQWLGNTKLYSFPRGVTLEVLRNGCISALTLS